MIYRRFISCFAVISTLCLLTVTTALAATITVDIAQKTAVSDSDMFTARVARVIGDQASIYVTSSSPLPQEFTLKVQGLKPGGQDLYINGAFKGTKPQAGFINGMTLSIPGRQVDPVLVKCIETTGDRVDAELKLIEKDTEDEHVRVVNTLRQAADWVKSAMMADKQAHSMDIIIAPADSILQVKPSVSIRQPSEVPAAYANACSLLQQARDRMYDNIKDSRLRNDAVLSMTAVDLKLSYYIVNGKAKGTALLTNYCNLPLSGMISPVAPAGWKVNAKGLSFASLAPGKSYKVDFTLAPSQKGAVLPASIRAQSVVKLGFDPFWAKFTLGAEAKRGTTVTVPVIPKPEPAALPKPVSPEAVAPSTPLGGAAVR